LNWIKDYVKAGIPADKLAYKLTMAGLEVEKTHLSHGDTVFEMEITPNRPDCLNMIGVAREISAICNKPLSLPRRQKINFPKKKCDITIEDKKGCARYIGTLIENVKIKTSPQDIKSKISALGLRSINNVVDITNFTLMENGQPLHAFDYDKLIGGKIIVRRAKKGEKIITIDEEERELDPSILVIADAKRPVAIAGVMGGKETEVTSKTKSILLESAYFDAILIRRASRKLGLSSDSSYRFERGVDYDTVCWGCDRAISLILKEAGGKITARADVKAFKARTKRQAITTNISRINKFLGATLKPLGCKNILKKLNCAVTSFGKDGLKVVPPTTRADITQDVDLAEEIARIVGYDNLPMSLPLVKATNVPVDKSMEKRKMMADALVSLGLNETITYTMAGKEAFEKTRSTDLSAMKVLNALTIDQEYLRSTLMPSLLGVVRSNFNKGQKDIRLFELGKIYPLSGEKETLGIILSGGIRFDWRTQTKEVDFYDLKGIVEQACQIVTGKGCEWKESQNIRMEEGQRADIIFCGQTVGVMGKIDREILENLDIKQKSILFAELDLEKILHTETPVVRYAAPSEYPAVTRDISIAVDSKVNFGEVESVVKGIGLEILSEIHFIEEYLGEKIPEGKRGLVFSLVYQLPTRTLTEEEVNKVHEKILKTLVESLGATLR